MSGTIRNFVLMPFSSTEIYADAEGRVPKLMRLAALRSRAMDRYVPLPPLPARISRLNELAYDLWWSWNAPAREVFRDLDYPLWRFTDHNPVLLLHLVEPERLEHASDDPEFLRLYDRAIAALDVVRAGAGTWWAKQNPDKSGAPIACIAPGFSLHQALPLDSVGSAILAGDYCKEASDLGVPLVGVGLMYARGYLHQRVSAEGWQQDSYEYLDWSDAPIGPALCPDGSRCAFSLTLAAGDVRVEVWQVRAGRVTIYLLDTDVTANEPWDRGLSSTAFVDDADATARQMVLLGAGAARTLQLLGIEPATWHIHEGASAFAALARVHAMVAGGLAFDAALDAVRRTTVFNAWRGAGARADRVAFASVERHVAACWPALGEARGDVMRLGEEDSDRGAYFSGLTLGVNIGARDDVRDRSARMPGVHVPTWFARELAVLVEGCVGADWRDRQDDEAWWSAADAIPDEALWDARQRLRGYLVDFARERARRRWTREQSSGAGLVALGTLLDPAALTVGFARRFTGGAHVDAIFQDPARLASMLTAARRPVQIIVAGRAHPGDEAGKHHLQRVFRRALDATFGGRIAFLEDYDLHAARLLVQGCDVWLSTSAPGRPSSLGALKAAINGVPGVAIDAGGHDAADARAFYREMEDAIVPAFYHRDRAGVPTAWVARVRETIRTGIPRFGARRGVKIAADRLRLQSAPNPSHV
jgi:starch phosphorylase